MLYNEETITICHKELDPETRLETWTNHYYNNCWWHEVKGSQIKDGYQHSNKVAVRIPYETNEDADITDISIRRYTL